MDRIFFALGSGFGGLAVALGAFGAHALRNRVSPDMLAHFETAVRYQFYHALALYGVGLAVGRWGETPLPLSAGWLFVGGIVLFSGALYLRALGAPRWVAAIAPIGGLALVAGWVCLVVVSATGV